MFLAKQVFIFVFIILVSVEGVVRMFEARLSGNINHIKELPGIAHQVRLTGSHVPKFIFIGNSLTNNAIDLSVIGESIRTSENSEVHVFKMTPDATALAEWYCIFNNYLDWLDNDNFTVVIGFAWALLSDQYPINASKLGGYFCTIADSGKLRMTGLTTHQEYLRFLAGKISHTYANRELIRNRILDWIIPAYANTTQGLNQAERERRNGREQYFTYRLLTKLVSDIRDSGGKIVLMAMPVITPYEIDAQLLAEVERLNVPLLDYRHVFASDSSSLFEDQIHLNSEGRRRFSKLISGSLKSKIDL
jgi:hypothetical protein